jgi:hypothetical protein
MRAVFGVVSLLVVLAIVGLLATRQLKATGQAVSAALPAPAGEVSSAPVGNVREQSQQLQQRVKSDVAKALEAGAAAHKDESDK